ncbi:MAG TPA: methyltransferase, partial [Kofleriaceae bacterium]|nr:methyltransferase [Kofleriaceae bacterium]
MGVFEPSSFLHDAALAAAHDLGLFDALSASPRTPAALAAALGLPDGHRLRALLDVLAALGALARLPGGLAAAPRFAAAAGARSAAGGATRPAVVAAGWGLLADVIRRDRPLPLADEARYHRHLLEAGAPAARELAPLLGTGGLLGGGASLLDLGGASLLDLGGGAGAYTAAFLEAHPGSRATLVDAPATVALAADHLARFGARVRLVAGDARTAAVG